MPIGSQQETYQGIFDGAGDQQYINRPTAESGLFGGGSLIDVDIVMVAC